MKLKYLGFIFILVSCKPKLNRKNFDSMVEYTNYILKKKDYNSFLGLTNIDTVSPLIGTSNKTELYMLKRYYFDELDSGMLGYKKSNIETRDIFGAILDSTSINGAICYVKNDTSYYKIKMRLTSKNDNYCISSLEVMDLNSWCRYSKSPKFWNYIPGLTFPQVVWKSNQDKKSFQEFIVRGVNNNDVTITELKLKLKLFTKLGEEFFVKTIVADKKILPEDHFGVKINELNNYYTGFKISPDTFKFEVEVLDINFIPNKPVKVSSSCIELERLKSL